MEGDANEDAGNRECAVSPISLSVGGKSFISSVPVIHVLSCLVLSCFSCIFYIYKHNYGAIVLGTEQSFRIIFQIASLVISSNR